MHWLWLAILVYVGILVGMALFQRSLMYFPKGAVREPAQYGLPHAEDIRLITDDGIRIQAWYQPATENRPTLLYFHGNAGHLGERAEKLATFADRGFGFLLVSYRGYGKSEGQPSEQGLYTDGRAGMAYLRESLGLSLADILLYGESLGSGIAVELATAFPVAGLILEAPYTSVENRAAELYPFIPVRWLIKDRFDSIGKIAQVTTPLLLFHGHKDRTMPVRHGRALLAAANDPKCGVFYPKVGHTDFDYTALADELEQFVKNLPDNTTCTP